MPDQPSNFSFQLASEADTFKLSQDIALALRPGDVLTLVGDLGVGKTTLCRGLIRTLTGNWHQNIPSPSFSLVQIYHANAPIRHFDFYRLTHAEELEEIGFFEELETSITLIEWPIIADKVLPEDRIALKLEIVEQSQRHATLSIPAKAELRFTRSFQARTFFEQSGFNNIVRKPLLGDASHRRYERIYRGSYQNSAKAVIFMDAPKAPPDKIIKNGKTYAELVRRAPNAFPFVALSEHLISKGLSAPHIYHCDIKNGFLLLEDLGHETLLDDASHPIKERYLYAIEVLAKLHKSTKQSDRHINSQNTLYEIPRFHRIVFLTEIHLLLEWFAPTQGVRLTDAEQKDYLAIWSELYDQLENAEPGLILRDFHAPNLLWLESRNHIKKIGLLDFQDALWGPQAYDLASLIYDARVTITPELRETMLQHYFTCRTHLPCSEQQFRAHIAILAAQRTSKILGIFAKLAFNNNKPHYQSHSPRNQNYLYQLVQTPTLETINHWHKNYLPLDCFEPNSNPQ